MSIFILASASAVAAQPSPVKGGPMVKKKPEGHVYVYDCKVAPPHENMPALYCKPIQEKKK